MTFYNLLAIRDRRLQFTRLLVFQPGVGSKWQGLALHEQGECPLLLSVKIDFISFCVFPILSVYAHCLLSYTFDSKNTVYFQADAVVSKDSDCVPFGAPIVLRTFTCNKKKPVKEFDATNVCIIVILLSTFLKL